jgi:hypothetical protein
MSATFVSLAAPGLPLEHWRESPIRRSRFTEERVALALRQVNAGVPVAEPWRKGGISEQTFCSWKEKYAGVGVVEDDG